MGRLTKMMLQSVRHRVAPQRTMTSWTVGSMMRWTLLPLVTACANRGMSIARVAQPAPRGVVCRATRRCAVLFSTQLIFLSGTWSRCGTRRCAVPFLTQLIFLLEMWSRCGEHLYILMVSDP